MGANRRGEVVALKVAEVSLKGEVGDSKTEAVD